MVDVSAKPVTARAATAECRVRFPADVALQVRGRATGWVAACTKAGGLAAQLLGLLGLVPGLAWAAVLALIPVLISLFLVIRHCAETRGRDLRDLEGQPG